MIRRAQAETQVAAAGDVVEGECCRVMALMQMTTTCLTPTMSRPTRTRGVLRPM
jgi:hypothetical protein